MYRTETEGAEWLTDDDDGHRLSHIANETLKDKRGYVNLDTIILVCVHVECFSE